ncbi:hypothetical protein BaRGS_00037264 [Batillaria attramentaria]|uniref:Uncharacterized protein n=1 Tax=Batillaria attramentaria TaxID=370345 RepID=A0ABD0J9K4_9CAEN
MPTQRKILRRFRKINQRQVEYIRSHTISLYQNRIPMSSAENLGKTKPRQTESPQAVSPRVLSWRHDNMPETLRLREEDESVPWWSRTSRDEDDVERTIANLGLSPEGRWSSPTDLTHPLDPFTSRYIHGKLDPVEQHVQGVTDAIQVARQKLANTHQFLQQSKQKRDATVDKLRNIPKDPSDWFIDVCRRGVVVPLRRTFPEDDRCEEVKTEAKKRLMLQFGIDEGVFPTKLIVKEITVQQNDSESDFAAGENRASSKIKFADEQPQCSSSVDSTAPRSTPSSRSLLQYSSSESKSVFQCDSDSSGKIATGTRKIPGFYLEISEDDPLVVSFGGKDQFKCAAGPVTSSSCFSDKGQSNAAVSSSDSQLTTEECSSSSLELDSLHFSATNTERSSIKNAKRTNTPRPASHAGRLATETTETVSDVLATNTRTSKKAVVTETSDERVCVKGHFVELPNEDLLHFTVFIFKEKTADESQDTVALSGSYIRKMLTTDKSLRWRFSHVSGEF